ncbi:MAG: type II secretion system F family protein [Acidimicrobiia bacterium]|nr:type II secretion system F family protein [Acidimicrobiia bacterium]
MLELLGLFILVAGVGTLWWAMAPDNSEEPSFDPMSDDVVVGEDGVARPAWLDAASNLVGASKGIGLDALKAGFQSASKTDSPNVARHRGPVDLGADPRAHEVDPDAPDLHRAVLEMSAIPRLINPLLESLGSKIHKVTPEGFVDRWEHKIALSGMQGRWTVPQMLVLKVVGLFIALVMGSFLWYQMGDKRGVLILVLLGWLGWGYPDSKVSKKIKERQTDIENKLPDVLDQMSVCVEAGLGFDAALLRAARSAGGPLAEEFGRTLQDIRLGAARSEALRALLERSDVADLRMFTRALIQAEKTGVPIAKVLRTQAEDSREKRRQRAEEKAMKLPVKLIFPLMGCILPSLFVVILGPAILRVIQAGGFDGK